MQQGLIYNLLITALGPAIWGTTFILATEFLPPDIPLTSALIRILPAGIMLLAYCRFFPKPELWGKLIILAITNISLFHGLIFIIAERLPGGLAALLTSTQPLIVIAIIWLGYKKPPRALSLLGTVTAIIGIGLMFLTSEAKFDLLGVCLALIAACGVALGIVLMQRWKMGLTVSEMTGSQMLFGGIILLPISLYFEPNFVTFSNLEYKHIYGLIYLSLISGALSHMLWFRGLTKIPALSASTLILIGPLVASILGFIILDESYSIIGLIGFTVVLFSILLVQWSQAQTRK